jgi:hypothetical protein
MTTVIIFNPSATPQPSDRHEMRELPEKQDANNPQTDRHANLSHPPIKTGMARR